MPIYYFKVKKGVTTTDKYQSVRKVLRGKFREQQITYQEFLSQMRQAKQEYGKPCVWFVEGIGNSSEGVRNRLKYAIFGTVNLTKGQSIEECTKHEYEIGEKLD